MKSEREKRLETLVMTLAELTARQFAYIAAIDDVVDPFMKVTNRSELDELHAKQWIIATLTATARSDIFREAPSMQPWGIDCSELIKAAAVQKQVTVSDTEVYRTARTAISGIMQRMAENQTIQ